MHPFIRRADSVTFVPRSPLDPGAFRAGDCIIFRDEAGRMIIHRVIRAGTGGWITTKGDALLRPDRPVPREMIRGTVNMIERSGSGRRYRLDRPLVRGANRLIAFLSRLETYLPVPARKGIHLSRGTLLLGRIIKAPKWICTRICFP